MKFARALFLPTLLLLLGTAPSAPLAALLERIRASSGEPYNVHIRSIAQQADKAVVRTDSQGLRLISRFCASGPCEGLYFDGLRLWRINLNDTALPITDRVDPTLRSVRSIVTYSFAAPNFENDGGKVDDAGVIADGKSRYRTLIVTPVGGAMLLAKIDPRSNLVAAVSTPDGRLRFRLADYRRIQGVMLPFSITSENGSRERYLSREVVHEQLVAPQGLTLSRTAGQSVLPFLRKWLPVTTCRLHGIAARCLFDTGSSGLSISLELAERMGWQPFTSTAIHGLGEYATGVVGGGPLEIGPFTVGDANYVILHDLAKLGYDIVLGADFFSKMTVGIDYGNGLVSLGSGPERGAFEMALYFDNFVPIVPVRLENLTIPLAVDTGDESSINLAYDYYARHHELFAASAERGVRGVGGSSEEVLGQIDSVQIGPFALHEQLIGATRSLHPTARGHLGAGFLRNFRLVFDYPRARMWLSAASPPMPANP